MKRAEEVLKRYIETPFRHTQIVEKDNAIVAMKQFADQFRLPENMAWIETEKQPPADYDNVLYFDSRSKKVGMGYFVWSQTPAPHITHWMELPAPPIK